MRYWQGQVKKSLKLVLRRFGLLSWYRATSGSGTKTQLWKIFIKRQEKILWR